MKISDDVVQFMLKETARWLAGECIIGYREEEMFQTLHALCREVLAARKMRESLRLYEGDIDSVLAEEIREYDRARAGKDETK